MAKAENLLPGTRVEPKFGPYGPGTIMPGSHNGYFIVFHDNGMTDSSHTGGACWDTHNLRLLDKVRTEKPEVEENLKKSDTEYTVYIRSDRADEFRELVEARFQKHIELDWMGVVER